MNYFIAPRSGERSYKNFQSTIKNGVPFENIEPFLTEEGRKRVFAEQVIYSWGNRHGTKAQWDRMEEGDQVIFYAKGELVMYGQVYYKQHSPQMALAMWPPDDNNNPWEYTYFLRNIRYIKLPMKAFNAIAGYKSNYIIQGFMHLRGEHLSVIEQQYGSMEELLKAFSTDVSEELPKPNEKLYVNIANDIKPIFRNDAHLIPKEVTPPTIRTTKGKKIDHLKQSKSNALTGSKGEAFAVIAERERLIRADRPDLAEKVTRVSLTDDSLGYDVLSYDANGLERCIEVKSTSAKQEVVRFYMSANEMLKSTILENYYVYYIDGVNTTEPRIISIKYPFDKRFLISPDTYLLQASIDKL